MSAVIKTIRAHRELAILADLRRRLERHPVFESLANLADLRRFMCAHVFAVWDFMSLLKRLQRDLTCVDVPWMPRQDKVAAHLINEIVLGEESDVAPNGEPASHLNIYLDAMREVGADTSQFEHFSALVTSGIDPQDAMLGAGVPEHVRGFVAHTLRVAKHESTLAVLANFFHGRENVIPAMFANLLQKWQIAEDHAPMFVFYLKRHIEVDGGSHGPMARQIIERLATGDANGQQLMLRAAMYAMRARIALWDGVHQSLLEADAA